MKKYRYFALDIDGTIFSSESIIYPVYRESIERYCRDRSVILEAPGRERIMVEIGKPVKKIFENLFPQLSEADRDYLSDSVLQLLCAKIAAGEGEFYPAVTETVDKIVERGGQVLVASNGRRPYIEAILHYCKLMQYIKNPIYIDGKTIFTKEDILRHYIARGIDPSEMVMVGDRLSDLEAAQAVDCDFAWCAYGHAPEGEIQTYTIRLEKFADLAQYA